MGSILAKLVPVPHLRKHVSLRGGLSFLFSLKLDLQAKKKQNVRNLLARGEFVNNRIKFSPEEDVLQNILSES